MGAYFKQWRISSANNDPLWEASEARCNTIIFHDPMDFTCIFTHYFTVILRCCQNLLFKVLDKKNIICKDVTGRNLHDTTISEIDSISLLTLF